MLYKRRDRQQRLCLLEISLCALEKQDFVFTDRNAAAREARFFNTLADLGKLPWDVLRAPTWHTYPFGRQQRCAEVLVPDVIPARFIKRIWAYDQAAVKWLSTQGCSAGIDAANFFRGQGGRAWH